MSNQVIKYYKGLPGSGKSTLAKAWVSEDAINRVRVNKDSIRDLLHNGKYSKGNEKQVLDTQDFIILDSLRRGKSVAFDNTHLVNKHLTRLENLLKENNLSNVKIEVVDLTNIEPEECIKRDLKRPNSVGQDVIWRMYWNHVADVPKLEVKRQLPHAVIVDIDGTLAEMKDRHPFEWSKVGQDNLRYSVSVIVDSLRDAGMDIILMSGRDSICREETIDWLSVNEIPFDYLFMRPENNCEKDTVIKERLYRENVEGKYNVRLVIDDRPSVIRMWKSLGLDVLSANPTTGEF